MSDESSGHAHRHAPGPGPGPAHGHDVAAIAEEIARSPARPGERAGDACYRQWLATLESLCTRHRLTDAAALDARTEQWRLAYLGTPHGRPVQLEHAAHAMESREA